MSRLEEVEGGRWADDVIRSSKAILAHPGGLDDLIAQLSRSLEEKPVDYAKGIRQRIQILTEYRDHGKDRTVPSPAPRR